MIAHIQKKKKSFITQTQDARLNNYVYAHICFAHLLVRSASQTQNARLNNYVCPRFVWFARSLLSHQQTMWYLPDGNLKSMHAFYRLTIYIYIYIYIYKKSLHR
jgi:hypothetical protein